MARISEKALRPRQYVFNRLTTDRISKLAGHVKKLKEQEQREAQNASMALHAVRRHEAARHAENIIAGITTTDPETEQIGALERELEELRERKKALYKTLRGALSNKEPGGSSGRGGANADKQPSVAKVMKKESESVAKPASGGPSASNGDERDAIMQEKDGRSETVRTSEGDGGQR